MSEIISQLKANGTFIDERCLSHISLLPYKHVIPMGTYFVDEIKNEEELIDFQESTVTKKK